MQQHRIHAAGYLLALAVIPFTSSFLQSSESPRRPNFLFIISDDQRWDALGVAGNAKIHTPVLDRLAAEGVWFRQNTIHVSQCSPTRCTLLTGLPPHQHRWYSNQYQHADVRNANGFKGLPTLPGLLEKAGYRSVLVGKWHPRPEPWNCGFSEIRVWLPGGGGPYLDPPLAQGKSREEKVVKGYTQEIFADDAIAFLKSPQATEKPFFLWLAFTAPHSPYKPTPERIEKLYRGKTDAELLPPLLAGLGAGKAPWKKYYQAVSHLDEQVGKLLATLAERKLADNTVVVFLGDNGYIWPPERPWVGKVLPYESSVRVPLIVRAPGIAKIKGANAAAASSLDLPVTFLRMAGVTPPKEWAGRDLTPLLRGQAKHGIDDAFCEWADNQSEKFGDLGYRLVRTERAKLIVWEKPNKPDELYDLVADPRESKNLIADLKMAGLREELRERLRAWMEKTNDPARQWKK